MIGGKLQHVFVSFTFIYDLYSDLVFLLIDLYTSIAGKPR